MKKGRHRRFEEARALKRSTEVTTEPCAECGADPEDDHAAWCLAAVEDEDDWFVAPATGPAEAEGSAPAGGGVGEGNAAG